MALHILLSKSLRKLNQNHKLKVPLCRIPLRGTLVSEAKRFTGKLLNEVK